MAQGIAVVTGASGGIGGAVARMIREKSGEELALALHYNRSREAAEALSAELPGSFLVQADLADPSGPERLLRAVLERGEPCVLVNNAGADKPHQPVFELENAAFDRLISVNLRSPLFLMKLFGREMARAGGGSIVNVSSVLARKGLTGSAVYRATKAALEELTKQCALELGPRGVRVNAVAPGFIRSAMTDSLPSELTERIRGETALREFGTPQAVAEAVWHLIENGYITGAVLPVDGGLLL